MDSTFLTISLSVVSIAWFVSWLWRGGEKGHTALESHVGFLLASLIVFIIDRELRRDTALGWIGCGVFLVCIGVVMYDLVKLRRERDQLLRAAKTLVVKVIELLKSSAENDVKISALEVLLDEGGISAVGRDDRGGAR